ncbi:MAG TPA: hypothetical protein VN253_21720 [Kofleriaceae bacterium]|nr:hypothetical protein [Kofleriaceae bacterium]
MTRSAEVLRILDRYLIEVVERYELCPWARAARLGGELGITIAWGTPAVEDWIAAAEELLASPAVRVAMVVAPELAIAPAELRALRDQVAAHLPQAGVADFHPVAALDLATPARLVPFLRRAPDPMLQLVPLALLAAARATTPPPDLAGQARLLGGHGAPPRGDVADRIAAANHATVTRHADQIAAALDAIAADRAAAYAHAAIRAADRERS